MNQKLLLFLSVLAFILLCFICLRQHEPAGSTVAPAPAAAITGPRIEGKIDGGRIVLSGAVPSEDFRRALVERATTIHGAGRLVDNLSVDTGLAKPAWGAGLANVVSILGGRMSGGSFTLAPDTITLRGEVAGEDVKAGVIRAAADAVGPNVRVIDAMTVVAKSATQSAIDDFLKGKIIEFASGSAVITPQGSRILDQLTPYLQKAGEKTIEISGHTDSSGAADLNMKLSNERAAAVKQYLIAKGLPGSRFVTVGYGSSRPVAGNTTPEEKQQNRRIEFAIQ